MFRAKRLAGGGLKPSWWSAKSEGEPAGGTGVPVAAAESSAADDSGRARRVAELEDAAFTKGYAAGEAAGFEAGHQRAEEMVRRMATTLNELGELRHALIRQTEQQMVQLALAIAKRILRHEVSLDHDMTLAIARVALDRLGEHAGATIRLHPEDHAMATGSSASDWAHTNVTFEADNRISRGGCQIESAFGCIDAGIDAQFAEVAKAVAGDESAPADVSDE